MGLNIFRQTCRGVIILYNCMSTRNACQQLSIKFCTMGVVPNIDLEKLLYFCVTRGLLGDSKTQKTGICSYTTQLLFLLNPGEHCLSLINRLSVILVPVSKNKDNLAAVLALCQDQGSLCDPGAHQEGDKGGYINVQQQHRTTVCLHGKTVTLLQHRQRDKVRPEAMYSVGVVCDIL